MKTKITVETKQLENINGSKMNYLILGEEGQEKVIINVGEKTYTKTENLLNPIGITEKKENNNKTK